MITNKFTEKGQALIVVALAAVTLFGFAALAIDGSRVLSDRRNAQNAADTAAMAAALAKVKGLNYSTAAITRATSNNYTTGINGATVVVNLCSDSGVTCVGVPPGADTSEYIKVKITSIVPMTFAKILGWVQIPNNVEAIARAQTSSSLGWPSGAAMVSLKPTGTAFSGNGNFSVDVNGSGIFSNSNSNCSTQFAGNGIVQVDTSISVASGGTQCKAGNITVPAAVAGSQFPYPPAISIPPPTFTCSGNGSFNSSTSTYNPGNYNELTVNGGTVTFAPGNYCFFGGVTINGNSKVTANNIKFRINASTFAINGNSTFTCSNMLVYGAGGTGIEFNGNGTNTCTGITFYMQVGKVVWNGNVANKFTAPTNGDYKGLLIYMPYGNNTELTINGNTGNQFTGSIIAVSSPITINGDSGSTGLHSQIIGYTIAMAGNSHTTINYDPNQQFSPPANPNIQFTK